MVSSTKADIYALAIALVLGLIANPAQAADSTANFASGACPFSAADTAPYHVDCGTVSVPENRAQPGSRALHLSIAIVRSAAPKPLADPVVFLEGGPGGPSLDAVAERLHASPMAQKILESRDLIYWDQRGTGDSEPHFCKPFDVAWFRNVELGFTVAEELQHNLAAFNDCSSELASAHIDLAQFGTATSAADLEAIRTALSIQHWNLYGGSYGTRLGLAAMRIYPAGIRAALLDGVYPPDAPQPIAQAWRFARVVDLMGKRCNEDPQCAARFPDIAARTYAVIERAAREPFTVAVTPGDLFAIDHLVVNDRLLAQALYQAFYDTRLVPYMPAIVEQTERRNKATFEAMAQSIVSNISDIRQAVYFAIECRESMTVTNLAGIEASNAASPSLNSAFAGDANWVRYCDTWQPERATTPELAPVSSPIPALLLAGDFDPVTPPSYATLAAGTLSSSTLLELPNGGHSGKNTFPCVVGIESSFLDQPAVRPDTGCMQSKSSALFVTHLLILPGLTRLLTGIQAGSHWMLVVGMALAVLLQLVCLAGIAVSGVRRRLRRVPSAAVAQRAPVRMALPAAAAALMAAGWLAFQVASAVSSNPNVLLLGLEGRQTALLLLAAVAAILSIFAIAELLLIRHATRRSLLNWLCGAGAIAYLAGVVVVMYP